MPDTNQQLPKPLATPEAYRHSGARAEPDKSLPRNLRMMLALADFEAPARRYLPRPMYGYVSGGAETNASLRANRAAFDDYAFIPRALVDVSSRSTKTALFGHAYDAPFGFAPMGGSSMAAYHGDIVLARSAAQANIPMIMSGASLSKLDRQPNMRPKDAKANIRKPPLCEKRTSHGFHTPRFPNNGPNRA